MKARTVEQVAERWGCSAAHVRKMCKDGRLRHIRLGPRMIRITERVYARFSPDHLRRAADVLDFTTIRRAK